MFLVAGAVLFSGYQLGWYGYALLQGEGMGFLDLLLPSRQAKASQIVDGWGRDKDDKPLGLVPVPPGPNAGGN